MNNAGDFGKTNPIFRRQRTDDRNKNLKGDNYDEKKGIFGGGCASVGTGTSDDHRTGLYGSP